MQKVLVTKRLNPDQEALAVDYGLQVIEDVFIKVIYEYDTIIPKPAQAWIVTSAHAANYLAVHFEDFPETVLPQTIFAVGKSTAEEIGHLGIPIQSPDYATADNLAELILKENIQSAVFFKGNLSKDVIPNRLQGQVDLQQIQVYETELLPHKVDLDQIQGVAFFSPSAVQAFAQDNRITDQIVVAIGSTTRQAVRDFLGVSAGIPAHASVEDVLFALKEDLNAST